MTQQQKEHSGYTFYWHDYESGGISPRRDRPTQFAGMRTTADFEPIGESLNIYCQPSPDYLPHPQACLITGITPQQCAEKGVTEYEFSERIWHEFSQPNSVILGYNNLSYDDEMTRFLFYRNFIDPYEHTYSNGSSRWDIYNLALACFALRPDGINWPTKDTGQVSLKLEELAKANGLEHEQAHDALSDVYATLGLAKLIKEKQPRLFEYSFQHRHKSSFDDLITDTIQQQGILAHVSRYYGAAHGYSQFIMPLGRHPERANTLIAWRLDSDPSLWLHSSPEQLAQAFFNRELDPQDKPGLVTIELNKQPFLAVPATLERSPQLATFDKDMATVKQYQLQFAQQPEFQHTCLRAFSQATQETLGLEAGYVSGELGDADEALYSGGFFSWPDKNTIKEVRSCAATPAQLLDLDARFEKQHLNTLLFRFKARNFPELLNETEQQQWHSHCQERLQNGTDGYLSIAEYVQIIEELATEHEQDAGKVALLKQLYQWLEYF